MKCYSPNEFRGFGHRGWTETGSFNDAEVVVDLTRKKFVTFYFDGIDTRIKEVRSREVSSLKIPENAHAFRFFDILSTKVVVGGRSVELKSEPLDVTPRCFYGGEVYTLRQLRKQYGGSHPLVQNVGDSRGAKGVLCRDGKWDIMHQSDLHIPAA